MTDHFQDYSKLPDREILILTVQKVDKHNGQIKEMSEVVKENTRTVANLPCKAQLDKLEFVRQWIAKHEQEKEKGKERGLSFLSAVSISLVTALVTAGLTWLLTGG